MAMALPITCCHLFNGSWRLYRQYSAEWRVEWYGSLDENEALEIMERFTKVIEENWADVCDRAELSETDRNRFWKSQFLNPFAFDDIETKGGGVKKKVNKKRVRPLMFYA